jgi:hypothetical protein
MPPACPRRGAKPSPYMRELHIRHVQTIMDSQQVENQTIRVTVFTYMAGVERRNVALLVRRQSRSVRPAKVAAEAHSTPLPLWRRRRCPQTLAAQPVELGRSLLAALLPRLTTIGRN